MMLALLTALASTAFGRQDVRVGDLGSLRAAVAHATPGTRILVAPGDYGGGVYSVGIAGTPDKPIVIEAADSHRRPRFAGAFQFQAAAWLEVRNLDIAGFAGNAIGIDDSGIREKPANHVTLEGLRISDIPGGGSSGIKMAGVDDFRVENCTIEQFGGCGIDMVGCHHGVIEKCRFEKGGGVAVQAKGASLDVVIRLCAFADYGANGVNLGQSTGIPFFRPPLEKTPAGSRYEAKDIIVEGCTFKGGDVPFAFAGIDGSVVRFNTIVDPAKWAMRILQETASPDFVLCRNGRFEDNIVVFRSDHWFEGGVNIGPKTAPETFHFARNWWYCTDNPERSTPSLPSPESDGVYGRDPMVGDDLSLRAGSPARKAGAQALPK